MEFSNLQKPNKQLITSCFFLIGLFISVYGLVNYNESNKKYLPVKATIVSSSCIPTQNSNRKKDPEQICNISVTYDIKGQNYKSQIFRDDDYELGDTITIYYDPNEPSNIDANFKEPNNLNLFFIVFGLTIFLLTIIYTLLFDSKKNNIF